jgi:hypothetical protein
MLQNTQFWIIVHTLIACLLHQNKAYKFLHTINLLVGVKTYPRSSGKLDKLDSKVL